MKKVSLDAVRELRALTSASIAECKKILEETGGDVPKAQELVRQRGLEIAAKKSSRAAKDGRIESYVHQGNKLGVLLEVNSETDFVARNSEFCQFTKDVAMQIAACNPTYLRREDVPEEVLAKEKDREAFCAQYCLLEQPFIKDPAVTIKNYLGSLVSKVGENIVIRRFTRYKIGE